MATPIDNTALDTMFRNARTYRAWLAKAVPSEMLRQIYDLARMGPTSGNCCPMRMLFITTPEAKARLKPALSAGNVDQTMNAPATAIFAYDTEFYTHFSRLAPHNPKAGDPFVNNAPLAEQTAFRSATLQAAYVLMAVRALGLDCGGMSGFKNEVVDAEFFPGGKVKSNFLLNIGYGDPSKLRPRAFRFEFDEVCSVL